MKNRKIAKSEKNKIIAQKFGKEFFDGSRDNGYGGFYYHPKYWSEVVNTFKVHYNIKRGFKILDVGCAKGFMLFDFYRLIPGIEICGIDISEYAIRNSLPSVKPFLSVGDAVSLPFNANSFDLVISINTIHNLEKEKCKIANKILPKKI